jgi:hypothetical protein
MLTIIDKWTCECFLHIDHKKSESKLYRIDGYYVIALIGMSMYINAISLAILLKFTLSHITSIIPFIWFSHLGLVCAASYSFFTYFRYIKNDRYLKIAASNNYQKKLWNGLVLFFLVSITLMWAMIITGALINGVK